VAPTSERHYDAIVVGSGFGGSVMTYRLREAGMSVCLLERGRAFPPGSFPRTPHEIRRAFWDPSEGLYGMFNVWSFEHMDSVVSSGLGGGSLIYANMLLRKDPTWFVREDLSAGGQEFWCVTGEELDPHYARVEKMLGATPYPVEHPPYDRTPKTIAFREAARRLGWEPIGPNLAVTFANPGETPVPGVPIREEQPNLHGSVRLTCRLCGECDIGCKYGSKNTLDYTYLSEAARLGAEIVTLAEVRTFSPAEGGGWNVGFVRHDLARDGRRSETSTLPIETISARRLILSAGTFGSTYLLLRNLAKPPRLLGTRFGGNGDVITMIERARHAVNGRTRPTLIEPSRGPVITSAVRFADSVDGGDGRGFYVQELGFPELLCWMLQAAETPGSLWRWRRTALRLLRQLIGRDRETDLGAEIAELFGEPSSAALLPVAGMGRDLADGTFRLRGDRLDSDWKVDRSDAYYARVRKAHHDLARALGGEARDNPTWSLGRRLVTSHPLGGCPMGRHEGEGAVSPDGEVFGHPGLFVADGSIMPGPIGSNPSLTIAAVADRIADRMIEARHA